MFRALRRQLSYANVVSTLCLFILLGGTSYAVATGSIGSPQIKNNSIRSNDVRNNELSSSDVRNGSLLAEDLNPSRLPSGPLGPQGPAGARGLAGPQGAKGDPCPSSDPTCRGPRGDTGAANPAGAAGPPGPQGAAGVSEREVVRQSSAFDSEREKFVNLNCPAGKQVIAGGGSVFGSGGSVVPVALIRNGDADNADTRWSVGAAEIVPTDTSWLTTPSSSAADSRDARGASHAQPALRVTFARE